MHLQHAFTSALAIATSTLTLASPPADQVPFVLPALETDDALTWPKPMPLLGFGTWNLRDKNTSEAVSWAIQQGYRHIDCAAIYGNEAEVGKGIADGLLRTGLTREHLWITSKLWNDHHDPNLVEAALDKTLHNLRTDYLDLYHMHWPVSSTFLGGNQLSYRDTWATLGLIRSRTTKLRNLGVSNFSPAQLQDLIDHTRIRPFAHQMELHPYLQQPGWLAWHKSAGIHVTAYSPLGGTNPTYNNEDIVPLLNNTVVQAIGQNRGCTPAQVALAWGISRGTSVIPKSVHKDHIVENLHATKCVLKGVDFEDLEGLGELRNRFNNPSKSWGLELYQGLEDADGKHGKETFQKK